MPRRLVSLSLALAALGAAGGERAAAATEPAAPAVVPIAPAIPRVAPARARARGDRGEDRRRDRRLADVDPPRGTSRAGLPLHRPTTSEAVLLARTQELDATLRDAVEDLGYVLDLADPGPTSGHTRDEDLVERAAKDTWVVSARLEPAGSGTFVLRIIAVPPGEQAAPRPASTR